MGSWTGTVEERWKGVLPAWLGIGAGWGGAVVLGSLLAPERLAVTIALATLAAVAAGVVITRRLLARNRRTLITTKDLRRR